MRVWLLGGFRVSVGSRLVGGESWRLRKAASLVKLLALSPGHRLHRERVMNLLWPELDARAATNNLHHVLHHARRTLEPTNAPAGASRHLLLRGEQLALCSEAPLWVDVEVFQEASAVARRVREPAAYLAAIDLYAGELLPEDRYERWAQQRREELRGTYLDLLVDLAALHEERAEYEPAIEALRTVIAQEPPQEEAHAGLMRLYALAGRPREALRQYGRLEEVLSGSFGRGPHDAIRRLRNEIEAGRLPPLSPALSGGSTPEDPLSLGRHNLPAATTSFVNREREMVKLKRELAMTRLLTLTGVGGTGKTRLAQEVAKDLIGAYPDGVWLVRLAGLSEPELVAQVVAATLGVREQPGRPLSATLAEDLRAKNLLLVLDNCEHLIEAVARLTDELLGACPKLRVFATSREPLRVPGEVVRRVPPLCVPEPKDPALTETKEGLARFAVTRLFLDRMRTREEDFVFSGRSVRAVVDICRRLEGIPLAIELAAVRTATLSLEQIDERLEDSLKLLNKGFRTADPRHQTLQGTLDWSHELLSAEEQVLFRRLSAFAGGWVLEAAEAVGRSDDVQKEDVLDLLSDLVDKSLVVVEVRAGEVRRYRLLEPVRQYAQERLEECGEADAVRGRHAKFFLALAKEAEPELTGAHQQAWAARLEAEHDNLRAALSWSLEKEPETALRLAGKLARFWEIRSRFSEGSGWLEAALCQSGRTEEATRAPLLTETGTFAWHRGDYERASELHGQALALYRQLGDEGGVAFSLNCLGNHQDEQGNHGRAVPLLEEALAISRRIGDRRTTADALWNLAEVARHQGDYERAKTLGLESLALTREMADKLELARTTGWLGMVTAYNSDDHDAAEGFLKESLALNREIGSLEYVAYCLEGFAGLAGARTQGARAARLWGAAEALRETISAPLPPADRPDYDRSIAAARAGLDDDEGAWEAGWTEGMAMSPEEAAEYALSEEVAPASESTLAGREMDDPLTSRECEVAVLVGGGLTNRQISSKLSVSERTVHNHVRNILSKLGLRSRTQIAVWAERCGLLP
jgi:predicted ATPase/DNA-binding SARP family transcriptional activator/DNA-binding CsgD family transcriptional regulator